MASAADSSDENVIPYDDELRAIQLRLKMLAQMAKDYPLQCSVGTCDFLFESRDEIEILVENLAGEISASKHAD
jgi:hypothetical protein